MPFDMAHAKNSDLCPFCGHDSIGFVDFSFGISGTVMVDVNCGKCEKSWREDYAITHRVDRTDGDEVKMDDSEELPTGHLFSDEEQFPTK